MHPKLVDYYYRFASEDPTKLDKFYTQLELKSYPERLPYLFGIENFCIRLYQAKINFDKICIYSDYDTDAVTATASMLHGLEMLGFSLSNLDFYAPDRFTEGYGMNPEAIQKLSQKFDLIVSVDCGINSIEEAEIVKKNSSDLIITDHHHLHGPLPKALAVINPRLSDYYSDKQKNPRTYNYSQKFDLKTTAKIDKWIQKTNKNWQEIDSNPELFMSHSVTGVGVAWFCLVWLGYFLEEIG